jgi:hypothetical protein
VLRSHSALKPQVKVRVIESECCLEVSRRPLPKAPAVAIGSAQELPDSRRIQVVLPGKFCGISFCLFVDKLLKPVPAVCMSIHCRIKPEN